MDCINLEKDKSMVRFFNTLPSELEVDIFFNDKLIFENINFKEFSKYIKVKEEKIRIDICESGARDNNLIKEYTQIDKNEVYTIAIVGDIENPSLLVINDYSSKSPGDDYSSFRVINLDYKNQPIDIVIDGDTLFKRIGFKEGTIYADVKVNEYKLEILRSSDNKIISKSKIKFKKSRIYTIYILQDYNKINLIQSVDGNTFLCKL